MSLKDRISSPLEAGPSILDAHHIPPHVLPVLEWTSSRLARKALHVNLVVARREYQMPSTPTSPVHHRTYTSNTTVPSTPATPATPATPGARFFDLSGGPVSALKQLVRSASLASIRSTSTDASSSPSFSQRSFDLASPRSWATRGSPLNSPPPMTASTTAPSDQMSSMMASGAFGMRLVHAQGLPAKTAKALRGVLEKAEKKFRLGPEWLSPPVAPHECGLTNQLVHGSIVQNEVLFSSEGLTLVSLDRMYSLKAALSSYSKTRSPLRLEDAVDDLRRIILAGNGAKVTRSDLFRFHDWLSISPTALSDLDRMYRRAYGGPDRLGAIAGMSTFSERVVVRVHDADRHSTDFEDDDEADLDEYCEKIDTVLIGVASSTTIQTIHPEAPSPKPLLQVQTRFPSPPKLPMLKIPQPIRPKPEQQRQQQQQQQPQIVVEEDDEETAKPTDRTVFTFHPFHTHKDDSNRNTINQVLMTPLTASCETPHPFGPGRVSHLGPATPNGYDDISPTTRGEWGFLLVDDGFQGGRKVTVETF